MRAFEIEMQRLTFSLLVYEVIAFAIAMVILYFVLKWAIRNGIRESGLVREPGDWREAVNKAQDTPPAD